MARVFCMAFSIPIMVLFVSYINMTTIDNKLIEVLSSKYIYCFV